MTRIVPVTLFAALMTLISPQAAGACGAKAMASMDGCSCGSSGAGPAGTATVPDAHAAMAGGGSCPMMASSTAAAADAATMPPGRMSRGEMGGPPRLMQAIHFLISHHDAIERTVDPIENGVSTLTRAPGHPELVTELQRHVREMSNLLELGGRIRNWDPLFQELFDHADQIELRFEPVEDGIEVRETSTDPYVVALIRAHAAKVDQFVARGMAAMHEVTPVPGSER